MKLDCFLALSLILIAVTPLAAQTNNDVVGTGKTPCLQAVSSIASGAPTVFCEQTSNVRYPPSGTVQPEITLNSARAGGSFSTCDRAVRAPEASTEGAVSGSKLIPDVSQLSVPPFKGGYTLERLLCEFDSAIRHTSLTDTGKCYGVGDCLFGIRFMKAERAWQDDADEATYPIEVDDSQVSTDSCAGGCSSAATTTLVNEADAVDTREEGNPLVDKRPARKLIAGSFTWPDLAAPHLVSTFSGTFLTQSVLFSTVPVLASQTSDIEPGTLQLPMVTSVATGASATGGYKATEYADAESREPQQAPSTETIILERRRNEKGAAKPLGRGK